MSIFQFDFDSIFQSNRREFLRGSGAVLSASAIGLLAGCNTVSAADKKTSADTPANDVGILNGALAAEQQAIAAYLVGAESGLLQKPVLDLAVQFQGHHKAHADLLAATIKQLGGSPVAPLTKYNFPTEKLKNQADVLRFAAELERGAVSAYLSAVPVLDNRELAKAAASILGDEAMHWAVLRQAVGENPVPAAFVG